MHTFFYIIVVFAVVGASLFLLARSNQFDLPSGETVPITSDTLAPPPASSSGGDDDEKQSENISLAEESQSIKLTSSRQIFETDSVKHSIPIEEIRQGCIGRDCIPSVDDPSFINIEEANSILPNDTVGIGLTFLGEDRFYPFNMLVTREIVNDVVGGVPLVVTYCPLCGTGIVFERTVDGNVFEFGVSGMLWQSNLLMYNRSDDENDISLWSQVLGEAVLGVHTPIKLTIVQSDIVRYTDWRTGHPKSLVLNTGIIGDPYGGEYYRIASSFRPNFDETESLLPPTAYVFGIEIDGEFKAYAKDALSVGTITDTFKGVSLQISKTPDGIVRITLDGGEPLPLISGFWFSWVAVHPDTELFTN